MKSKSLSQKQDDTSPSSQETSFILIGNPNCGKTSLYNRLSNKEEKEGNYPGVTVDVLSSSVTLLDDSKTTVLDVPGVYSLYGTGPEEAVIHDVLKTKNGENLVAVCITNETNLKLNLKIALECLEIFGKDHVILVLNMHDIAKKDGISTNTTLLSETLGIPVIQTNAFKNHGLDSLKQAFQKKRAFLSKAFSFDRKAPTFSQEEKQKHINELVSLVQTKREKNKDHRIDHILLHPVWGTLIFFGILFAIFQFIFSLASLPEEGFEFCFKLLGDVLASQLQNYPMLLSFLRDGLFTGFTAILTFIPQIALLYFFIAYLEDSGYMARVAILMDRLMGYFGLHGRSIIPLITGFGCAIPAITSLRMLPDRKDRLTTLLVIPLMPCTARLPIYTLIIGAFIPNKYFGGLLSWQGLVMFGVYIVGVITAVLMALLFKKTFLKSKRSSLILELPRFNPPRLKILLRIVYRQTKSFVAGAGGNILKIMVVIWFLCSFPQTGSLQSSYAGMIAHAIAPAFAMIGFNELIIIALIAGLVAREVSIGVLASLFAIQSQHQDLTAHLASQWSLATALSFLTWYIFAPQCLSTLIVAKKETKSWRWPLFMFTYMFALAYLASFIVFQIFDK